RYSRCPAVYLRTARGQEGEGGMRGLVGRGLRASTAEPETKWFQENDYDRPPQYPSPGGSDTAVACHSRSPGTISSQVRQCWHADPAPPARASPLPPLDRAPSEGTLQGTVNT